MEYAVPGQYITPLSKLITTTHVAKYVCGMGTRISNIVETGSKTEISVITATKLGRIVMVEEKEESEELKDVETLKIDKYIVHILANGEPIPSTYNKISINLPQEGDIVLVRVNRISNKQANVEIISVEGKNNVIKESGVGHNGSGEVSNGGGSSNMIVNQMGQSLDLGETFKGIIRLQNIRSTERDKLKMIDCFKPGDIVRCIVISLGDGTNYYLSTARNDLGVVFARAFNGLGGLMYAIDWETMVCAKTGETERRKCAKPIV